MTVCPVAIAVGCRRCPVFAVCPLKSVLGDQAPGGAPLDRAPEKKKPAAKRRKPRA